MLRIDETFRPIAALTEIAHALGGHIWHMSVHSCVSLAGKRQKWRPGYLWCARRRIMNNCLTCRRTIWQNKLETMSSIPLNGGQWMKTSVVRIRPARRVFERIRTGWKEVVRTQTGEHLASKVSFSYEKLYKIYQVATTCANRSVTAILLSSCVAWMKIPWNDAFMCAARMPRTRLCECRAQQSDAKPSITYNYRLRNHYFSTLTISLSLICCTL